MRRFAAGLVVGGALGWGAALVVRPDAPLPPHESVARATVEPRPAPRTRSVEPPADTDPKNQQRLEAPREDLTQRFASGSAREIAMAMRADRLLSDAEVGALADRLAVAQHAGDPELYVALLRALGASRNAVGRARLVEVLGDTSVPLAGLKTGIYGDIRGMLGEGETPVGTGAAARRRLDAHIAAGDARSFAMHLTEIVAQHGSTDDLAWLGTMIESRELGWATIRALTTVRRDVTAPVISSLLAAGKLDGGRFVEYTHANPKPAWELVAPLVAGLGGGSPLPPGLDASQLLRAYGAAAPAEELGTVCDRLMGLPTPELRVAALSAVQALADRKIDVTSLAPILDAPIDLLAAPGEIGPERGHACMYGIQHHRVAWSIRSADALESAAPRAGSLADGFRDVAKIIRAHLADPWRRK